VRLTTSHRKTLLLRSLNRGGQGPIWAVAPLDGWIVVVIINIIVLSNLQFVKKYLYSETKYIFFVTS
jgi:hypothetical protein